MAGCSKFNILFTSFLITTFAMSFEVRVFQVEEKKGECFWKFQLGKNSASQVDFYAEEESVRSLFHLAQDIIHQIETVVDKKKKKQASKDRTIRKICEKMIKCLSLTLKSFANDIQESVESVSNYFSKLDLSEEVRKRIEEKCQKWIIEAWVQESSLWNYYIQKTPETLLLITFLFQMSLPAEMFFKSSKKYLESLFKDGKKITPDFQLLNEFYLIVDGDNFESYENSQPHKTDNLVLIDVRNVLAKINLTVSDKYISQSFLWNPQQNSHQKVNSFIEYFLTDILFQNEIQVSKEVFQELKQQVRVQLRSQSLYKNLLKKHANVFLNFSVMQISQDVKEYLVEIDLRLMNEEGQIIYEDSFEWDIMNDLNNVEQFCINLMQDQGIPRKYLSQLCYKIKTQINKQLQWKFTMLAKTFKSIHKDRQSPKLNTQTLTQVKKTIIYSMDVSLPSNPDKSKISSTMYLNNSDLFSTLSRNFDILPEQFQQILQYKQTNKIQDHNLNDKNIAKTEADKLLKSKDVRIEDNKYVGNFTNSYKMHNIWRQALEGEVDHGKK